MKKIFFVVVIFVFGFIFQFLPIIVDANSNVSYITRTLKLGSTGEDVKDLQTFLQSVGLYNYGTITGYYGPITENAVQQWQTQQGIVSSGTAKTTGYGVVGPKTRAALAVNSTGFVSKNNKIIDNNGVTTTASSLNVEVNDTDSSIVQLNIVDAIDGGGYETGNGPLNVIDDSLTTRWAHYNMPVSLILDLGSIKVINQTKISFYKWDEGRIYTYSIDTSLDQIIWSSVVNQKSSSASEWTTDSFTHRQARYIKITNVSALPYTLWAGMWEVQVWGSEQGTSSNPPTVSLTSPLNGDAFTAPATIELTATASDSDGSIIKVGFYNGSSLLSFDTSSPYSYSWANVPAGSYTLTAKTRDNSGVITTSSAVNVVVNDIGSNPPTVSLTSPLNGDAFTAPATIELTATASDSDGSITKVDFYNGSSLLYSDTSSPYSYSWTSVPAGSYTLTAKATDNSGVITTSSAVNVVVNVCSGCGTGQTYLPSDRSIDWNNVGVPGGIPTYPVSATLSVGATSTDIVNALNNAPTDTAVLLSPGTYTLSSSISIPAHKVLRGSGEESTIIQCATSTCFTLGSGGGSSYKTVTGGFQLGSKEITVSDASGFTVGSYGDIRQDWDDSYFHCGYDNGGTCPDWGLDKVGQVVKIVGKSGNTLTFEEPLYFTYTAEFNPRIAPQTKREYVGLESLKIIKTSGNSGTQTLMSNCANCWIKNIWSEKAADFHVDISSSYKSEIRESIFNDQTSTAWGEIAYGVRLAERTTSTLIENNIFNHLRHSMAMERGPAGNVWGYNYSRDPYSSVSPDYLFSDIAPHGHYPTMNLYEGNIAQKVAIDNVWGTHGPNTIFRNRIERDKSTSDSPIDVDPWNPYQNIIGNDLGLPGQTASSGAIYLAPDIASTILVHGNYYYVDGQITKWEPSLSQTLPASLYLSNSPSWWGGLPWPAFGPDTSHSNLGNTIPAKIRYETLAAQGKFAGVSNTNIFANISSNLLGNVLTAVSSVFEKDVVVNNDLTSYPVIDHVNITQTLKLGSTGEDVKDLQTFLQSVGLYNYGTITGYYGPITENAVQQWQTQQGIVSSGTAKTTGYGVVGPKTRAILNQYR